jgi:hypothetical protein
MDSSARIHRVHAIRHFATTTTSNKCTSTTSRLDASSSAPYRSLLAFVRHWGLPYLGCPSRSTPAATEPKTLSSNAAFRKYTAKGAAADLPQDSVLFSGEFRPASSARRIQLYVPRYLVTTERATQMLHRLLMPALPSLWPIKPGTLERSLHQMGLRGRKLPHTYQATQNLIRMAAPTSLLTTARTALTFL